MILVTGVSGFIGKHLLKSLITKYGAEQIVALTSKPITECAYLLHQNYQFEKDFFFKSSHDQISTVVHAGSYTPKNFYEANDIVKCYSNIHSVQSLIEAFLPTVREIIFLSTLDVYRGNEEITETSEVSPVSLYGNSKLYSEKILQTWADQNNKVIQILRIGHVYGPGEEAYQKLIPVTFKRLLNNEPIEIWGEGNEIRSFIYVQDVVDAVINSLFLQQSEGIINVAGEEQIRVKDLVQKMIDVSGANVEILHKPTVNASRDLKFDISKLKRHLLAKQTSFEAGLRKEWEYVKTLNE